MNKLLESIVNNFINGNISDCKVLIREYATKQRNIYDLLFYYKSTTRLSITVAESDVLNDKFINTIYRALLFDDGSNNN